MRLVAPHSIVDIGCGEGIWLKAFKEGGIDEVRGIDGDWVQKGRLVIPEAQFVVADLKEPVVLERTFDLSVCLEVAEHLPDSAADTLIKSLTDAAPVVLFSAALPLQGGSHHVNEQWPAYWAEKFNKVEYVPVDAIRRHIWDDTRVSFFYAQNIFIYVKKSELSNYALLEKEIEEGHGKALPLIHPFIYTYYAERWRMVVPILGKFPPSLLHGVKSLLQKLRR
jgi:SAM-dependent methyltransferase